MTVDTVRGKASELHSAYIFFVSKLLFEHRLNTDKTMKYDKEQLREWKTKWGDLYEISVEGKSCVLHKPTRKDLSYASVVKDPIKLSEVMLKQLWVAGDEELQEQDDLFMAVVSKMEDVLKVKEAEIKKL